LKPRERVLKALEHEEPDMVPIDLGGVNTSVHVVCYEELRRHLGVKGGRVEIAHMWQRIVKVEEPVYKALDIDFRHAWPALARAPVKTFPDGSYIDGWGIKWIRVGYYYEMAPDGHPLKGLSPSEIDEYPWPDPYEEAEKTIPSLERVAKYYHEKTDYATVLNPGFGFFERSWYMRSFEEFFLDLKKRPYVACKIMDKILDFQLKYCSEILSAVSEYVDVDNLGDDLAMQDRPLISLETYRRYVKPRQRKLISLIKAKAPHVKIFYHTCGSARYFYDDLAEIGVDIINPVQVSARDMGNTKELKERYGDKLVFWGAIDTQRVLPFGSVEDVKEEVKRRIGDLAPGGGYVLCAVHNIQPGVPPENIVTMYKAAREYGRYPVRF